MAAGITADVWGRLHEASNAFQRLAAVDHNLIAEMPWETSAMAPLGLTLDQFRFTVALLSSVFIGYGITFFRSPTLRHLYSLITGVALVYYPFGAGIIHVFPPAILTWLGMAIMPRKSGTIAWLVNFPYLIYLHVINASGESWNAGRMDFTGGQMVLVLKVIALAVCRADGYKKEATPYQSEHKLVRLPNLLAYFSYLFSLGNLLAGPFFEYSDYETFIQQKGLWERKRMPGTLGKGLMFVLEACVYMGAYQVLGWWKAPVMTSDWYYAQNLAMRIFAMTLIGFVYQLRYFFAWKLSEASLTMAGLNYLGKDEKTGKDKWGRCSNANFIGMWTADSARTIPQVWNTATGIFLRRYVYERITPKNKKPHFGHLLFTQMVSAVWHGLYAGYQIFFAGSAIWIYSSQVLFKAETHMSNGIKNFFLYRLAKIMWTNVVLCYMASAFQLLEWSLCVQCYNSVKWIPHWIMAGMVVLGFFVKPKRPASEEKKKA